MKMRPKKRCENLQDSKQFLKQDIERYLNVTSDKFLEE
jgi:hypothetical protein